MPSTDTTVLDFLERAIEFHKQGCLTAALNNYRHLKNFFQESNVDFGSIFCISLDKILDDLLEIAHVDLYRNSKIQDLAIEIVKTSDKSCVISYDRLPSDRLSRSEKNNLILKIQHWYGRLGNNLFQISNAIAVAKKTDSLVIFPEHPTLKAGVISYSLSYLNGPVKSQWMDGFFTPEQSLGFDCSWKERREALLELPDSFFAFAEDPAITESTLVIHLRSGDVLSGNVGNAYHQPPLGFYCQIIEMGNYREVVIITEESRMNPCAQALVERYQARLNSIRIQHGSLQQDMDTILSARHLVISNSSFPVMLGLASKRLRYVHCFVPLCAYWGFDEIDDLEALNWSAPDYPGDLDWSDVDAACAGMLNFPAEKITPPGNLKALTEVKPEHHFSGEATPITTVKECHQSSDVWVESDDQISVNPDPPGLVIF